MVQTSPSVVTAARVLKYLTRYKTARATLTQIAVDLDLPKSSTSRILKALVDEHLLDFDALTRLYSLGPYAVVIGSRAEENVDYLTEVRSALRELAERTTLTAAWIQRVESDRLMYVAKHEGTANMRVAISIGNRFPLTEVSFGQWVVAYADEEDRATILAQGLPTVSGSNITDPVEYLAHCAKIRREGVVTTSGAYMPGIWAASTPVLGRGGQLLGVLAVIGLAEATDDERRRVATDIIQDVTHRLNLREIDHVLPAMHSAQAEQ